MPRARGPGPSRRVKKAVLVTGAAGFIGTHVVVALATQGHHCVCLDNFSNSTPASLDRVRRIVRGDLEILEIDIRDAARLRAGLAGRRIDSVIHLAGLKAVGESVEKPLLYYDNNVTGSLNLLQALEATGASEFVFSSSATVYGVGEEMPLRESAATRPQSPYGRTKLMIEEILADHARAKPGLKVAMLRYFNPVGAHDSGLIGESPSGTPNNVMPFICQVAAGLRPKLRVFGSDYPTNDGTGVRDYIHVMDLADGHVAALDALGRSPAGTVFTANLGTGTGHSVLELVERFERVNGVRVARELAARRPGDVAVCYADPSFARRELGWEARRGLDEMCRDAWRWQRMNPQGYGTAQGT
jgi:UDP-glucose 4-epimerase